MKKFFSLLIAMSVFAFAAGPAMAVACRDVDTTKGILTASVIASIDDEIINSAIDATGCDIGVFIPGDVNNVTISTTVRDANKYGIFNEGKDVNISNSEIYNIGNHVNGIFDPNGVQTGLGIYFVDGTGIIEDSKIYKYQKGGIVITGQDSNGEIINNDVTGLKDVPFIAQNGIQFGYGAKGEARGNTVDGNWYTGVDWTSTGILLFDVNAKDVKISNNKYLNNQTNHAVVTSQACPHMYGGVYESWGLCSF